MKSRTKWIISAVISLLIVGAVCVWSIFYNWGVPYFQKNFSFSGMVLPFIVFFIIALLVIRFFTAIVCKVVSERQRIKNMTPEEREAEHQKFLERQEEQRKQQAAQADARMAEIQAKIKENNVQVSYSNNVPKCPKCGCTSISADKKGFGIGKAVVGAAVAGPIGLVAGNIGAKKVRVTCLNCGHHWLKG